uniref:Uncharacterized protein n=1 Tax=candidate division WOR-3 bacterium TaxID=2052148 RepID=A0A7V1EH01_UNCW3
MDYNLLNIFIDAVLGKNIVLYYILGICPLILYKANINKILSICSILTIIMVICSSVCLTVNNLILIPLKLNYLQILLILIITYLIIHYTKILLSSFSPALSSLFDKYTEFFYTNYAVYGLVFLTVNFKLKIMSGIMFSFGSGIGYLIVAIIFMAIKDRLWSGYKTGHLKRIYVELIILGLVSLIFMSITGLR